MKIEFAFLSFLLLFVFSSIAHAQYEWERVYNNRTGNYEDQFNPYNQAQQDYERQQQQRLEDYERNMRAINESFERQREAQRQIMEDAMYRRMELQSRLNYGYAIIKAGKATTSFKPTPTFSIKNYFLQQANSPKLKQIAEQYAENCLKQFQTELRTHGMSQTDYAEGKALEFIINYEIYFDEKPSPTHLTVARQFAKESYLKDAVFQSYNDLERQQKLEPEAAATMYAKYLYANGKAGDANALLQAKLTAKAILEKVWGNTINTILMTKTGFIHRGAQIIADGKATHLFKYNPNLLTAEINVRQQSQFRADLIRDNKQNLQFFYQAMTQKGGQKGDLAWCGAMIASANYYVLTKHDWNAVQLKSAYDFVKAAVLKSPDAQAASDEVKQIVCETMAIQTTSNYVRFTKGEFATTSTAQLYLGNLFRALGENANNYQWTANGIVKVK